MSMLFVVWRNCAGTSTTKIGPASNIQCSFKWDSNGKLVRNDSDEYSGLADMQGEKIINLEMNGEIENESENRNEIVNDDCANE